MHTVLAADFEVKYNYFLFHLRRSHFTPINTGKSRSDDLIVISNLFCFVIMQLWVGIMVQSQSFFIAGIEDEEKARSSAFGAMGMFLVTFVASLGGMWYDSRYKAEPLSEGGSDSEYYLSQGDVPTYGTAA